MFAKLMEERVPLLALVVVGAAFIALLLAFHEYAVHADARLAAHRQSLHGWHTARSAYPSAAEPVEAIPYVEGGAVSQSAGFFEQVRSAGM